MSTILLEFFLRLYLKTVRVSLSTPYATPCIIALWHKDLPACITAFKHQNITVQISASKDAQVAHRLCRKLGYTTCTGSSSSLQGSIRHLHQALNNGQSVGVALDGPRGPAGKSSGGTLWLHKKTQATVAIATVHYSRSFRLNSWDKMHFPLPFSKVTLSMISLSDPTVSAIEELYSQ